MADLTSAQKLAAARAALHDLRLGRSAVEVDFGDYRAKFTPANEPRLAKYVADLEAEVAASTPAAAPRRGAIGFIF